jgi:hypothetical protein
VGRVYREELPARLAFPFAVSPEYVCTCRVLNTSNVLMLLVVVEVS